MFKSTVFWPARVVGEVEEKGTITCLYVCVHCKMFLVEDILWWVTAEHAERNISVRVCGGAVHVECHMNGRRQTDCSLCRSEARCRAALE